MTVLSEHEAELFGELAPFAVFIETGRTEDGNALSKGANLGEALLEVLGVAKGTLNVFGV